MSGLISAAFIFEQEKRFRIINELNYAKMLSSENYWAGKVLRQRPLEGKSERLMWLLSSASIEQLTPNDGGESGGKLNYDELATVMVEYFPAHFARGYRISKIKYINALKNGLDPIAKWTGDVGMYGAYVPQRGAAALLMNGEAATSTSYDGVPFFSKAHLTHPLIASLGTYANLFTGAAVAKSGLTPAYPGACPIDDSISLDTAFTNLSKILSYITGAISQPNGAGDPRMLEPMFMLYPPRMQARVEQMFDSNFIAQLAGGSGGAGSSDVKAFFRKYRMLEPVCAKELDGARTYTLQDGTTVSGDDTAFYIVCKEASDTELGALIDNVHTPFYLQTYSGEGGTEGIDAVLGRSNDLEYHYQGWRGFNYGHPFAIFKGKGA
jgi:hypothetical protein